MRVFAAILVGAVVVCAVAGCATNGSVDYPLGEKAAKEEPAQAQAYSHYLAATLHERNGRFEDALAELQKASELASTRSSSFPAQWAWCRHIDRRKRASARLSARRSATKASA